MTMTQAIAITAVLALFAVATVADDPRAPLRIRMMMAKLIAGSMIAFGFAVFAAIAFSAFRGC